MIDKNANFQINSSQTAAQAFWDCLQRQEPIEQEQEQLWVIGLSAGNLLKFAQCVFKGTFGTVLTHSRDVFRMAIHQGAIAIFLAHNHPNGDATPSQLDIDTTRMLREASRVVDIPILDHIIFGNKTGEYRSLSYYCDWKGADVMKGKGELVGRGFAPDEENPPIPPEPNKAEGSTEDARLKQNMFNITADFGDFMAGDAFPLPGTIVDTAKLPYTKDVIKEALRYCLTRGNLAEADAITLAYLRLADFQDGIGDSVLGVNNNRIQKEVNKDSNKTKGGKFFIDDGRFEKFSALVDAERQELQRELEAYVDSLASVSE